MESSAAEGINPVELTNPDPSVTTTVDTGLGALGEVDGYWSGDTEGLITVSSPEFGTLCTTNVFYSDPDNTWSCTPSSNSLLYGTNHLSATNFDGAESSDPGATALVVRTPPTPTITLADGGTLNPAFDVKGTVLNPYGQELVVAVSDTVDGVTDPNWCQVHVTTTDSAPVAWDCPDTLGGFGPHTFTARAWVFGEETYVGADSNTLTERYGDTSPPTTINSIPTSANQRPTITGTGPAGGTVQVRYSGAQLCGDSVPIDGSGSWTCTADHDLEIGTTTVTAQSTYADGMVADSASPVDMTITVPKPGVSYSFGPSSIAVSVAATQSFYVVNTQLATVVGGAPGPAISGCPSANATAFGGQSVNCSFGPLDAGVWSISSGQEEPETMNVSHENDVVRIPETPTLSGLLNPDHTVRLSGHATAGDLVTVSNAANATICTATATASNSWSCSITPSEGTYTYKAIALSQGFSATNADRSYQGYSAYTAAIHVVVPAPTAVITYTIDFTTSVDSVSPGDTVTFSGTGPPGATVDGELHSTPIALGSTTVGADGTFTLVAHIPMDVPAGAHHFVITVTEPGQTPVVVEKPVTVMEASTTSGGSATTSAAPRGFAGAGNRNAPATPSVLTSSLPTIQTLIKNPIAIGVAAAGGLALLLFVAFPAELLNTTLSENYERMFGRVRRIRMPWMGRVAAFVNRAPFTGGLVITVIAALIFGFADPHFGFDLTSLRLVLACGIALFIIGYCANALAAFIVRKRWAVTTAMALNPLGLVLTLVGVVISRLIDFSPGILIGLIIGMSLTGATTVAQRANAVLIKSGIMLGMSVVAWVGLSLLQSNGGPTSFLPALANDTLAGITTEGLTALVVNLLPFRLLDGEKLFARSWRVWAVGYLVALVAFCVIVLPSEEHWKDFGSSFLVWIIVVVAFAAVTLGLYLFVRTRYRAARDSSRTEPDREATEAGSGRRQD